MNDKIHKEKSITTRIWMYTSLNITFGIFVIETIRRGFYPKSFLSGIPLFIFFLIFSSPALLILSGLIQKIKNYYVHTERKITLLCLSCLFVTSLYGICFGLFSLFFNKSLLNAVLVCTGLTGVLFLASLIAIVLNYKAIRTLFSPDNLLLTRNINQLNTTNMQQDNPAFEMQDPSAFQPHTFARKQNVSNKILLKGGITALLILLMLIPVSYIQELVTERKERQEQIIDEVSSKWAASQTVTPPYLVIPYKTGDSAKPVTQQLVILAETVSVKGNIEPEKRHRSNYDVLLYRSQLNMTGEFKFSLPKNIRKEQLILPEAKVCAGISDSKGIEKKVVVHFNNTDVPLSPGLPVNIDSNGLSALVDITQAQLETSIPFSLSLQIKGSSQLHFKPMSGNSSFELNSTWPHPSFDGNVIPVRDNNEETTESSFPATWNFSNANLPFSTVLQGDAIKNYDDLSFGVSLVQPVNQYAKAMRSIKYAIFVIGLTFALFFIIEILQKNPVHPIQYVLVGLALVIFYSLLLSISEFLSFDYAYLIAATATVVLITLYTKSHFKNWKTAGIFFGILSGLYSFIYTLISLEDTALLAGSIALFVILAVVMYASRKINWYQPLAPKSETQFSSTI